MGNYSYKIYAAQVADPFPADPEDEDEDEDEGDGEGDGEGEGEGDGEGEDAGADKEDDSMSGVVKFAIVASLYTVTIGALFVLMGVF